MPRLWLGHSHFRFGHEFTGGVHAISHSAVVCAKENSPAGNTGLAFSARTQDQK
jgi:hypothetical protein